MAGIQAGGGSAGRLSIEIVAEVARLQSDMDKVRRLVKDASGEIARNAKAANDNLASIGRGAGAGVSEFTREVARLKGSIDPAWAALQRYKDEVNVLRQALAQGAITHQQFVAQMRGTVATYQNATKSVDDVGKSLKFTAREGLNFSRQMSDIGVTAAMGMNPLMIAIQQGPQLLDIFQEKAIATGTTVGVVAKAAGAQIYAAVAPLLPIIAAVSAAALAIGTGFALGAREINKGGKSVIDGMGLTEKQLKRVKESGIETGVTIGDTFFAFFEVVGDRLTSAFDGPLKWLKDAWNGTLDFITTYGAKAIEFVVGGFVGGVYAIKAAWKILPAAIGDIVISAANATVAGIEWMINKAVNGLNGLIDLANAAAAKVGMEGFGKLEGVQLGRQENPYAGEAQNLATAVSDGFGQGLSESKGMLDRFWADVGKEARNNTRGRILKEAKDAEKAAKARKEPKTEAEKFADLTADIQRQITMLKAQREALDLSDNAALELTNQQKLLNDAQAKGIHVTEQQRAVLMTLADQLTEAQIALRKAQNLKAANEEYATQIRAIGQAGEQIGVYGKELTALTTYQDLLNKATNGGKDAIDDLTDARLRGKAAALADKQAANDNRKFMEDLIVNTETMQRAMEAERGELGLTGAMLEAYRFEQEALEKARQEHIDLTPDQIAAIKATGAAYGEMRAEIDNAASRLGALNGMLGKGALSKFMGVLTSNDPITSLLNMGGLGSLAGLATSDGQASYKKQAQIISDGITKVFPKMSKQLSGSLAGAIQSAGIGMISGRLLGGRSKSEQAGSAIGGALGGSKAVEKVLGKGLEGISKGLGDFAGPLGSMLGGVLGNVLGGMMTKVKWGRVDLSSSGVSAASGNSGSSEKAALQTGNSIFSGLKDLATQLGGVIGDFGKISVGVRHGDYRVNEGGTSLKVKKGAVDFNDDAEAAVAYAMKLAIERGAITGIRNSTNNLLKAGDDLQAQLQKAMSFEGVFTELKGVTDPVGAALDEVNRQFDQLRVVFKEAGATAEEYAQLEQLLTIRRNEALDKERDAIEDIRSRIAEAQGDDNTVKQIARAKELKDALNDNVRAELRRLYVVEDATAAQAKLTEAQSEAAAKAEQLRDAWASIGGDLMDEVNRIRGLTGGSDGASFATLQGQFNAAVGAARSGDQAAASKLADLSQSLIEAAQNAATSRQELDRVKAETAATLEGVARLAGAPAPQITGLPGGNGQSDNVSAELRDTREELAAMLQQLLVALAAIASNTGASTTILRNVTPSGNALAVEQAA